MYFPYFRGRQYELLALKEGVFSMPISSQVSDMLPHYHDTLMLLKKYRDIAWIVEVSSRNLQVGSSAPYSAAPYRTDLCNDAECRHNDLS